MKTCKKFILSVIVLGILFLSFSFKSSGSKRVELLNDKYEYAVIHLYYGSLFSYLSIEYSNGEIDDLKKTKKISNESIQNQWTLVMSDCFNYLIQQNYKFESSHAYSGSSGIVKEYIFSRKVSE